MKTYKARQQKAQPKKMPNDTKGAKKLNNNIEIELKFSILFVSTEI